MVHRFERRGVGKFLWRFAPAAARHQPSEDIIAQAMHNLGHASSFVYIRTYATGSSSLPCDPSTRSGQAGSGRTAAWYVASFVGYFCPTGKITYKGDKSAICFSPK